MSTLDINTTFNAETRDFESWAKFFHIFGFIILNNAISPDEIIKIKSDIITEDLKTKKNRNSTRHTVHKCFFEKSPTTVDLISDIILTDFAQYLIADCPGGRGNTLTAHVIHNNAFTVGPNGCGQAPMWHTDDSPQNIIIPDDCPPLPNYIKLPILAATYMIWLSNCDKPENGPTYVVPGSHRFGKVVNSEFAKLNAIPMCGMAGTAVLVNNQLWHRGVKIHLKLLVTYCKYHMLDVLLDINLVQL